MSSSLVQLTLIPCEETGSISPAPKRKGFSSKNQPMKYHPEVQCQGIGCSNIIPAGYVPSQQKRFFCSRICRDYFEKVQYTARKKAGTVRKSEKRHYRPAGKCEGPNCDKMVPAGFAHASQKHYFCSDACEKNHIRQKNRERYHEYRTGSRTANAKRVPHHFSPEAPCEGPECTNIVPAGFVSGHQKRRFCSEECRGRFNNRIHIIGKCKQCGGPIRGQWCKKGKRKFCSQDHEDLYETDRMFGPTGPFRQTVEEYLKNAEAYGYSKQTVPGVKGNLCRFFSFVNKKHISTLEDIRPWVITDFIAAERARGLTSGNFIGHISTFFKRWITEQRVEMSTPVMSGIHVQNGPPPDPRPYGDHDIANLWKILEASGNVALMLATAIGEECGLRVGEVANIRLSDVNVDKQEIFVRLPTKNKRKRTVPYHDKVKKYVGLWLQLRDQGCGHDHLLHSKHFAPFKTGSLDSYFRDLFASEPEPAASFSFHRLRHTWATRLMNNGMELAVLKELGGWVSWNSMQRYIKVLEKTVRDQYMAAYATLQARSEVEQDEMLSFLDYAAIDDLDTANHSPSVA